MPAGRRGPGVDGKEVAAKRAEIPELSPRKRADPRLRAKGSRILGGLPSLPWLWANLRQTCTLEDEEAARTAGQEKAKAHTMNAARL